MYAKFDEGKDDSPHPKEAVEKGTELEAVTHYGQMSILIPSHTSGYLSLLEASYKCLSTIFQNQLLINQRPEGAYHGKGRNSSYFTHKGRNEDRKGKIACAPPDAD